MRVQVNVAVAANAVAFNEIVGAPRRNRTYNLWIKSPLLCQLS